MVPFWDCGSLEFLGEGLVVWPPSVHNLRGKVKRFIVLTAGMTGGTLSATMVRLRNLLMGTLLLLTGVSGPAMDTAAEVWLEIPELGLKLEGNGASVLPSTVIDSFVIRINRQSNQLNYGSITAKINTESANIVMTAMSTAEGVVCNFDLNRQGGFRLRPGRNSVEIAYYDRWQRLHYASFLLQATDNPRQAPRPQLRPERLTTEKYAVVVGIARYQNAGLGLTALKHADRDAEAFRDYLLSPEGGSFKRENIMYLVNEEATSTRLRSALFTFLTRPRDQDFVVLYFAGHGAPDPNDRRNLYLLTYDTKVEDMGGTAFPMWQLQDVFTRVLRARRVVTFADSCHSYGISGQSYGASSKSNNLINQYLTTVAGTAERAILTASDVSQLSMEGSQWGGGHGVFTYFVLKGIRGEADLNRDGVVTAGELFYFVREQVKKETGGEQTPLALPGLAESLALSGVPNSEAPRQVTSRLVRPQMHP